VGRSRLAGTGSTGPARGQLILMARGALALLAVASLASCTDASAATSTKKKTATTRKKVVKRPVTTKRPTTTKRAATTVAPTTIPKLSAQAKAVLAGYETYLLGFVGAARNPETAQSTLPESVTGDALARLLEIAAFNVSEGIFWDGTRADIQSKPRVESLGDTRAVVRDCRSVGGVLRKRTTNEIVPGSTEPDVDDLVVDLVMIEGRWVVSRTDRTNQVEGRSTCAAAPASP
jgi:hypothetical protein